MPSEVLSFACAGERSWDSFDKSEEAHVQMAKVQQQHPSWHLPVHVDQAVWTLYSHGREYTSGIG